MAQRNDLTTEQVVTLGTYMWEHRELITKLNKCEAHSHVANVTGITLSWNVFHRLSEEMNLKYDKSRKTGLREGLKVLRSKFAWQGGNATTSSM